MHAMGLVTLEMEDKVTFRHLSTLFVVVAITFIGAPDDLAPLQSLSLIPSSDHFC
jgi:hypothetical protein